MLTFSAFRTLYYHQIILSPTTQKFVTYLSLQQNTPATNKSYLAGISFQFRMCSTQDTTQSFVVKKTLSGYSRLQVPVGKHKSITFDILSNVIKTRPVVYSLLGNFFFLMFSPQPFPGIFSFLKIRFKFHSNIQNLMSSAREWTLTFFQHHNSFVLLSL